MILANIFQFFLPFMLVFIIIYAILQKTKVASSRPDVNIIISFTIAFLIAAAGLGWIIAEIIMPLALLTVIIVLIFIIFAFFGAKPEQVLRQKWLIALIAIIAILLVFSKMASYLSPTTNATNFTNVSEAQGVEVAKKQMVGPQATIWIIGNPQVLSAIIILVLAAILAFFLLYRPAPPRS